MKNILDSKLGTEILSLNLPKGLRLQLLNRVKKFGLDKVLLHVDSDKKVSIEIVSKYFAEYHKNRFTGRYNKTLRDNITWLNLDAEYNSLQVIDLR
jgi:hypothetical protein|tara:strand:- start:140 stop:427 length:288 start_codon:yes stop_codon:yes gene_type:complete